MRHLKLQNDGGTMIMRGISACAAGLPLALFAIALLFLTAPAHGQNVQVDLSATSNLCGGAECFNADGLFAPGTTFLGTSYMDGSTAGNCTPPSPYPGCPDAFSSTALGLSSATPPTLTPPSLNVPFTFGAVNTSDCSSPTPACVLDVVNFTTAGVAITLPAAEQSKYSTAIVLGTAVNGSHNGIVTLTYTDSTTDVFSLTMNDWCSFSGTAYESIAVGPMHRINADGTSNGANCNLYAYSLPVNVAKELQGITLTDGDGSGYEYAFAITLKPPSYTIAGGVANPTSISPGSTATATVTVNPQPGYTGTITFNSCNAGISPTIVGDPVSAATPPTCSFGSSSVTVTGGAPPTTTLTFTAVAASKAMSARHTNILYAFFIVPGLALTGLGFGSRNSRSRKLWGGLLLLLLLSGVMVTPACVSYTHLGNVGTPPGQYTVTITGVDGNGLTQASNPAGTSNTVVITVTN
jgi:hypothetical protein